MAPPSTVGAPAVIRGWQHLAAGGQILSRADNPRELLFVELFSRLSTLTRQVVPVQFKRVFGGGYAKNSFYYFVSIFNITRRTRAAAAILQPDRVFGERDNWRLR